MASKTETPATQTVGGVSVHSVSWWRVPAVAALGAIATLLVLATAPPYRGGDVGSVLRHEDRFLGQRVTVAGRVGEVISAKSFTITDGSDAILVVGMPVMPAIDDDLDGVLTDERVKVRGMAKTFTVDEVERDIGELLDARYERFAGKPVIVADSVVPL